VKVKVFCDLGNFIACSDSLRGNHLHDVDDDVFDVTLWCGHVFGTPVQAPTLGTVRVQRAGAGIGDFLLPKFHIHVDKLLCVIEIEVKAKVPNHVFFGLAGGSVSVDSPVVVWVGFLKAKPNWVITNLIVLKQVTS
jgi:hypothetical protein